MTRKKTIRGRAIHPKTGMPTKYDSLVSREATLDETPKEFCERISDTINTEVDKRIEYMEELAKSVLKEGGYPDNLHPLDYQSLVDDSELSQERTVLNGYIAAFFLREALKKNQTHEAARQALRMEWAISGYIVFQIEYSARVGEAQLNSSYNVIYTDDDKSRWEQQAKKLIDTDPNGAKLSGFCMSFFPL